MDHHAAFCPALLRFRGKIAMPHGASSRRPLRKIAPDLRRIPIDRADDSMACFSRIKPHDGSPIGADAILDGANFLFTSFSVCFMPADRSRSPEH